MEAVMISPDYVRELAAHNTWQNMSFLTAADALTDAHRKADRGAFFGSIHATLNHLLWGDQVWLNRFGADMNKPPGTIMESVDLHKSWDAYCSDRRQTDRAIGNWADSLTASDLTGDVRWTSGASGREVTRPKWLLVTHMFNHQTHHRGQVHAMLTAEGVRTDATDIPFRPE